VVSDPWKRLVFGHPERADGAVSIALITGGFTLGAVALTLAGNAVTGHQRDRRAARNARDAAIAELLAASIDLVQAVNVVRGNRKHQTDGRARMLIAAELFLSPHTIKSQMQSLYRKLDATTRHQAITRAHELELIDM
jgi:Bacterial regulatory proteins, luxR family